MCPACQQKEDDGFIALVEIDPSASTNTNSLEGVFRTGRIAHLKIDAFRRLFTTPLENIPNHPKIVFVDHEVMEHLIGMMPGEAENEA